MLSDDILKVIRAFTLKETYYLSTLDDYINFLAETRPFVINNTINVKNVVLTNIGLLTINLSTNLEIENLTLIKSDIDAIKNCLAADVVNYVGDIYTPPRLVGLKSTTFSSLFIRDFNNKFKSSEIVLKDCVFETEYLEFNGNVKKLAIYNSSFSDFAQNNYLKIRSVKDTVILDEVLVDSLDPIIEICENVTISLKAKHVLGIFDDCIKNLKDLNLESTLLNDISFARNYNNLGMLQLNEKFNEEFFDSINKGKLQTLTMSPKFSRCILGFRNISRLNLNLAYFPFVQEFPQGFVFIDGIGMVSQSFHINRFFPQIIDLTIVLEDIIINNMLTEINICDCKHLRTANLQCYIVDGSISNNSTITNYSCGTTSFFDNIIECPKSCKQLCVYNCSIKYIHGLTPGLLEGFAIKDCKIRLNYEHMHNVFCNVIAFSTHNSDCKEFAKYLSEKEIQLTEVNGDMNDNQLDVFYKYPLLRTFTKKVFFTS